MAMAPDDRVVTELAPDGKGTLMTMNLPDAKTLKMMLDTGMADGMEKSYQRMEKTVLA